MAELIDWARNLTSPGILVMPQPLIVQKNNSERNLLSFKSSYAALIEALGSSGRDIVLLSGDVHYGRIAEASLGANGGRLVEIISSPLSNLTGLNGIATSSASAKPSHFPPASVNVPNVPSAPVSYDKTHFVTTKRGWPLSAYPKKRTREHMMTISLSKSDQGVLLKAQAWRVRERTKSKNLPVKDFSKPFRTTLQ